MKKNNKYYKISTILLEAVKEYFNGNYEDIPKVKIFWHNVMYLFFSSINYRRIFDSTIVDYQDMSAIGIMPNYLCDFYIENESIINKHIENALACYFSENVSINECRQELLNNELYFSTDAIRIVPSKVSRDSTGSYYTPNELATEVVRKIFDNKIINHDSECKIIDFSCGGGEFFIATMTYLRDTYDIPYDTSAKWLYGVDVDPITLQNCIVNLLVRTNKNSWNEIISHFFFGNPLLVSNIKSDIEEKNNMFAIQRIYSVAMGMPKEFFERKYDVVIGNPPWEKIRFEERKFFRGISKKIADIPQKHQRQLAISEMEYTNATIFKWSKLVCDDYAKMTATKYKHPKIEYSVAGELNTYSLFTELGYNMLSSNGAMILIVKSTLVTAPVHQSLWKKFLSDKTVHGIFMYDNTNKIFNIDSRERFIVFWVLKEIHNAFDFATGLNSPQMLNLTDTVSISEDDLAKINPDTYTIPNVRNNSEVLLLKRMHSKHPLFSEVYSDCHFGRLIHLTAHASMIDKVPSSENVPIYEGKFIEQYDARYSTFKGMPNSQKYANKATAKQISYDVEGNKELPEARYYVQKKLWGKYSAQYPESYSLCWRSLTSPTNRRTMIAMILPTCPTCQSIQMLQIKDYEKLVMLLALFNSIPFDYLVRIKMPGLDLTQSVIKQIPVPSNDAYEEIIDFGGYKATIKKHILSYTISILREERRLSKLIEIFSNDIYDVKESSKSVKQKMIDVLFKNAYHLDDDTYESVLSSFPKYQEVHIV